MYHITIDDGLTYLCLADEAAQRRIAFAYLQEIKNSFQAKHAQEAATAPAASFNSSFSSEMAREMVCCGA